MTYEGGIQSGEGLDDLPTGTGPFTIDEVRAAAGKLNSDKATANDEVPAELILLERVKERPLLNTVYKTRTAPGECPASQIAPSQKRGELQRLCSNTSLTAKLFNRIILVSHRQHAQAKSERHPPGWSTTYHTVVPY